MSQNTITDSDIIEWLDRKFAENELRTVFRDSTTGRGWRIHQTDEEQSFGIPSYATFREAVLAAMTDEYELHV